MTANSSSNQLPARRPWPAFLLLCTLFVALVACGGNDDANPTTAPAPVNQAAPGTQLQLVCNLSCQERAQCGAREVGGGQVVLMNRGAPSVDTYDMAVPVGTMVTVQELRTENVREISTQFQFGVTFLRVILADQAQEGWVPDWCLAYP